MYGVDKVPDKWFEKVPGGFYKAQQKAEEKTQGAKGSHGEDGGKKPRRYSHNQDDRRRARRDRYEDERRSDDKRRQDRRGRSSYDGSHDDDFTKDDRRGAKESDGRRRRHSADRYGHKDGSDSNSKARNNAYYGDRKHDTGKQSRPTDPYFDERQRPVTGESSRGANQFPPKRAATMMERAAAAETGAQYPQPRQSATMPSSSMKLAPPPAPDGPRASSIASKYTPYAHIYGQPDSGPHTTFAPPPTSPSGPAQSSFATQLSSSNNASEQGYQQNPFAQQAPTAADAGAGAQYTGQPIFSPQPKWPTSVRAFTGYENKPPYPESPRPGRSTDRYSPSYASHEKERRDSDVRRTRSERRPDGSGKGGSKHQGKHKPSLLSETQIDMCKEQDSYVDPRAPLKGQANVPPPPAGPPPAGKDSRRDSAQERYKPNGRGYTSD